MKSIIRSLVVAAFTVAWLGTAGAQPAPAGSAAPVGSAAAAGSAAPAPAAGSAQAAPAPAAGSAQAAPTASSQQGTTAEQTGPATPGSGANTAPAQGTAPVVPEVSPANKGAASGTGPAGTQSPGPSTQPAGGAGVAWYDALANKPIEEEGTFWMPKAVNAAADESDMMFYSVLALSAFFFFAILICVVYFTWKYRHRPGHKSEPSASHNDALEITWTVIPTIIVVFLFWYGWRSYIHVVTPPQKAVEIQVLAMRWNWQFTHANGVTDSDLHVPVDTPVRLVMTSKDVLHSFYAPAMRVKQDVVPRRYTYAWFKATKPGTYRLTCAEYCGTSHAQMACLETDKHTGACLRRAVVVVHAKGDYERYLADKANEAGNMAPVDLGKMVYEKKGCNACHTIDGSPRVGPTWLHAFGGQVTLTDGTKVPMDENYIRESMMSPQAKIHQGFPPSMPSFEGQLKENEINGVIEYIKSLK